MATLIDEHAGCRAINAARRGTARRKIGMICPNVKEYSSSTAALSIELCRLTMLSVPHTTEIMSQYTYQLRLV